MREHPGDLLSARLDGELAPDAEAAVDEHVAACAACRRDLDALARTRTLLRGLPQVEAPPDLLRRQVDVRHRSSRRGATVALVAAGVAVALGMVVADPPADGGGPVTQSLTSDAPQGGTPGSPTSPDTVGTFSAPATASPGTTAGDGGQAGEGEPSLADRLDEAAARLLDLIGG